MITERHVQAIWYDRALRPDRLFATGSSGLSGGELRVVHPGAWNLGPGPDFLGAVVEVGPERRRLAGDVEVHLSPSDWDAHGHGDDPAYAGVVLHVTWAFGPPPATLPPHALSVWLGRYLLSDPGFSPDAVDLSAYPFARLPSSERPCKEAIGGDPDAARATLAAAGRRRLVGKAERIRRRLAGGADREQFFYSEVMGALGYTHNAAPFRAIAAAVPYRTLVSERQNAANALIAAASFADVSRCGRPGNSPERRLVAAAELFTATDVMSLMDADDFSPAACRAFLDMMAERRIVGHGRGAAVIANIVLPWAMAEGRVAEPPEWLPPEDVSWPVRLTAFRLLGRDHNPAAFYSRNGLFIQGLIGIHREFCLPIHPECAACALKDGKGDATRAHLRAARGFCYNTRHQEPEGGMEGHAGQLLFQECCT